MLLFQMTRAIQGINNHNKELMKKYHKEMALRKKYFNELVELKGELFLLPYSTE